MPNDELMVYKVVALTRLACPQANIPSTTALATINKESGRELGLQRGANIVMPNLTPPRYRVLYEIYPARPASTRRPQQCRFCLRGRIESIGAVWGAARAGDLTGARPEARPGVAGLACGRRPRQGDSAASRRLRLARSARGAPSSSAGEPGA